MLLSRAWGWLMDDTPPPRPETYRVGDEDDRPPFRPGDDVSGKSAGGAL